MFDVVLVHPEIPPNTGNVIRLCATTGPRLHLVRPLGLALEDRQLRRAGLAYPEYASVRVHEAWKSCAAALAGARRFASSRHATRRFNKVGYREGDVLVFGA